jgi:hypothetical protein
MWLFKDPSPFLWLSPLWRGHGPSFVKWKKESSLYPRIFVVRLIEIGQLVLEIFITIFSIFLLFCYRLPLEKRVALHLKYFEFPLSKYDVCQLWLKAQRFWSRSWKCKSLTDRPTTGDQKSSLDDLKIGVCPLAKHFLKCLRYCAQHHLKGHFPSSSFLQLPLA